MPPHLTRRSIQRHLVESAGRDANARCQRMSRHLVRCRIQRHLVARYAAPRTHHLCGRYVVAMTATRVSVVAAAMTLLASVLVGCSGGPGDAASATPKPTASSGESASPTAPETPEPTPSPTQTMLALPDDCRAILSDEVLAQLDGVPLNDPGVGPTGVQADGSLLCIWRDPRADTTALATKISYLSRGPALEMLDALADNEGYTCFTPDGGTRCEKTWPNGTYPVTEGRTLFWRDDVLIDTTFSNLAPSGYTSSIVEHLFG